MNCLSDFNVGNMGSSTRARACRTVLASLGLLLSTFTAGCAAMSSVGQARVIDVGGRPCFSASKDGGAAEELELGDLYVTETKSSDWKSLPVQMWALQVLPPGATVGWKSDACMPYGHTWPGTHVRVPEHPLEFYRVYAVFIGARAKNDNGSFRGYKAEFCVTQMGSESVVREIVWDAAANRWLYEVCAKK